MFSVSKIILWRALSLLTDNRRCARHSSLRFNLYRQILRIKWRCSHNSAPHINLFACSAKIIATLTDLNILSQRCRFSTAEKNHWQAVWSHKKSENCAKPRAKQRGREYWNEKKNHKQEVMNENFHYPSARKKIRLILDLDECQLDIFISKLLQRSIGFSTNKEKVGNFERKSLGISLENYAKAKHLNCINFLTFAFNQSKHFLSII